MSRRSRCLTPFHILYGIFSRREKKKYYFSEHLFLKTLIDKMETVNDSNMTTQSVEWFPGLQISACIFYSMILLVGVTGNILVLIIVAKYQDMRNATNLLLANLSVADLFLLLFCSADGYQHLFGKDKHRLGKFMCM